MPELVIAELIQLLRECAGEDEGVDLDGADVPGRSFTDLGYDSLALHNTVNRVQREYGVRLPDQVVADAGTPQELLEEINKHLRQSV